MVAAQIRQLAQPREEPAHIDTESAPADVVIAGDLTIDARSTQAYVAGRDVELTAAEFRILHALAGAGGEALNRAELSRRCAIAGGRDHKPDT